MTGAKGYQPPKKPRLGPVDIDAMPPGRDAALAAIELDDYASRLGKEARMLRDRSIRAMWANNPDNLTQRQIAAVLGVSLGTVRAVCR